MRGLKIYGIILAFLISCKPSTVIKEIWVKNDLDLVRKEVVSIKLSTLGDLPEVSTWIVKSGNENLLSQFIDVDEDSIHDELLFFVDIKAKEEKSVTIEQSNEAVVPDTNIQTYSRFVPERIGDYAWENDLVAFRTYGPEAQRLVEGGKPGGTLSSGMDCWLKRVDYSIIDAWYKKYTDGGTYHKDDGEGYDPYHVGDSRGCGGIGIWIDDSLFVSKNFIAFKKIVDGPVRNVFELTYVPWLAGDANIQETKRITIDLGNQLYKVEDHIKPTTSIPNITIGITLHDGKGIVYADSVNGIFSHWEPIDDSEIGTGVVIDPAALLGFEEYRTTKKDLSQLHIFAKPENIVTYYTGFAWKKAGKIETNQSWNVYLEQFAQRLRHPLEVTVK